MGRPAERNGVERMMSIDLVVGDVGQLKSSQDCSLNSMSMIEHLSEQRDQSSEEKGDQWRMIRLDTMT